MTTHIIP